MPILSNFPSGSNYVETDPTVPAWAKAANKPSYTASEVGALSVNGGTVDGTVEFTSSSEGVAPGIQFATDGDHVGAIHFYGAEARNTISIKPDPTAIGLGYAFVIGSDGLLRFNGQDVLYMGNVSDLVTPDIIGAAAASHESDSGVHVTSTEKTEWSGKADVPKKVTISFSTSWTASGSNYTQTVTVSGGTANSLVALQPTAAQIVELQEAGVVAMMVDNNNGTFTATAIGAKPSAAMNIQATITEVE